MQFLVFACALAFAAADFGAVHHPIYAGPQHLPVIGPNGVPVDTPAVQQATSAHLHHKVEAHARNGDYHHHHEPIEHHHELAVHHDDGHHHHHQEHVVGAIHDHHGHHGIHHGGAYPLDTPEVAVAKANHFAAHAEALARTGHSSNHYLAKRQVYAPWAYYTGTPIGQAPIYHHYLAKRQVYASPVQYAHVYPSFHSAHVYYRNKRQVYTPYVHAYTHHHAYPTFAHYY